MHGAPVFASCFVLLLMVIPLGSGDHTESADYRIPLGASVLGFGPALIVCPYGCDLNEDGTNESGPIGGVTFYAGSHQAAEVTAQDPVWGSNVAMRTCIYERGTQCIPELDEGREPVCGSHHVYTMWPSDDAYLDVFIDAIHISSDLDVCGATRGTVQVDWR